VGVGIKCMYAGQYRNITTANKSFKNVKVRLF